MVSLIMARLTLKQFERLNDIMDYMTPSRPELEWRGFKAERKGLTPRQWHYKLSVLLYVTYNDLYPNDLISREAVLDYFDDEYTTELISFCKRFKKFFTKCFSFKKKQKPIEEEEDLL